MRYLAAIFFASLFLIQGPVFAERDDGLEPAEYFFIPAGNAEEGKKAFNDLKCATCHQAANQMDSVLPIEARIAPVLGPTQAEYPAGWIANSIVSPSHTIALDSDGQSEGSKLSRMPDLTDAMTVRQLFDLVAYIQSQGESV